MEYQLVRMSITYNLSLDLVCIIISQLHMHLGSWCRLSWKKKYTIWLRYVIMLSHLEILQILHTYYIFWVILCCGYPVTLVANHAYITHLLYILSCTMCDYPTAMVANHAYITHLLCIMNCIMLWLSCSYDKSIMHILIRSAYRFFFLTHYLICQGSIRSWWSK